MVRAPLLLSLFIAAGEAPPRAAGALPPPQAAPPAPAAPAFDRTPSDPAALGFLTGVVDRRLYSLQAAGATKVTATVHAVWDGRTDVPPPVDFEVVCDVATGAVTSRPLASLPDSVKPLLPSLYALGFSAFALLPSRADSSFVLATAQEGELTRIDYKPRSPATSEKGHSEWHKKDGTPVRRKFETMTAQGTVAVQELVPEFTEADGRLLLKEMKAADPKVRLSMQFEYAKVDGYRALKRLVQTVDDLRIVLDFKVKIEAGTK